MSSALRSHAPRLLLALAAVALAPSPARATEPPPAPDCVKLVAGQIKRFDASGIRKLQEQVQAYRVTRMMIDAIGKKLELGAAWTEGNPRWDEAYALFQPDLYAAMRAGAEREMHRMETKLPQLLDPATCKKHLAVLASRPGAAAARLEDGVEGRKFLASLEKAFGIPPRLRDLAKATRQEIAEAAATPEDPAVAIARGELGIYGKRYAAALKQTGDADPEVERKASGEAATAMMARNRASLDDIVRRYRAAKGG